MVVSKSHTAQAKTENQSQHRVFQKVFQIILQSFFSPGFVSEWPGLQNIGTLRSAGLSDAGNHYRKLQQLPLK
jgi:hypothetical protein